MQASVAKLRGRCAKMISDLRLHAFVFDKDGTLVDTESVWFEAYRRLLQAYGATHNSSTHQRMMGLSAVACVELLCSVCPELRKVSSARLLTERARFFQAVRSESGTKLMPGVAKFLRVWKGKALFALATSANREDTLADLECLGWNSLFEVVVTSDDVVRHKPEPDVYLEAARRLGVAPADCLAFEDGLQGVRSAIAAGAKVVQVCDARFKTPAAPDATMVVNSFEELLAP